jgi:hypothetical protein
VSKTDEHAEQTPLSRPSLKLSRLAIAVALDRWIKLAAELKQDFSHPVAKAVRGVQPDVATKQNLINKKSPLR